MNSHPRMQVHAADIRVHHRHGLTGSRTGRDIRLELMGQPVDLGRIQGRYLPWPGFSGRARRYRSTVRHLRNRAPSAIDISAMVFRNGTFGGRGSIVTRGGQAPGIRALFPIRGRCSRRCSPHSP